MPVQIIQDRNIILFFNTQNYQFRQWSKQSNILQHSNSTGIDSQWWRESQSRWPKSYFKGMLSSFHFHSTPDLANHLHDTAKIVTSTFILSNTLQHHMAYSVTKMWNWPNPFMHVDSLSRVNPLTQVNPLSQVDLLTRLDPGSEHKEPFTLVDPLIWMNPLVDPLT